MRCGNWCLHKYRESDILGKGKARKTNTRKKIFELNTAIGRQGYKMAVKCESKDVGWKIGIFTCTKKSMSWKSNEMKLNKGEKYMN